MTIASEHKTQRCKDCWNARVCDHLGDTFNSLQCVYCAARYLQRIGKNRISKEKCAERRKKALADSVAAGLDEQLIRKLFKVIPAYEPEPVKQGKRK